MIFILRQSRPYWWALCSPKGHELTEQFRGNKSDAVQWANAWISSFSGACLKVEEDDYKTERS